MLWRHSLMLSRATATSDRGVGVLGQHTGALLVVLRRDARQRCHLAPKYDEQRKWLRGGGEGWSTGRMERGRKGRKRKSRGCAVNMSRLSLFPQPLSPKDQRVTFGHEFEAAGEVCKRALHTNSS